MTPIEKAYHQFKQRNDKTKTIDGKIYFRIVCSDYFEISERRGLLSVVPSPDMPQEKNAIYQDENGNHFTFGGHNHIRFSGEIPEWYLECGECNMKWQETKNIGKYLTVRPCE